ncbi:MAG: hypothetical protein FWF73_01060 [Spirochaetes bacterium]|nr:hypothetical protein [Spirochaetota bacterium]
MNSEFETAYNCIIMHHYNEAYNRFKKLYYSEQDNSHYFTACIISLLLKGNIDILFEFIEKESVRHKHSELIEIIFKQINFYKPSVTPSKKTSDIFNIIISCFKAIRQSKFDELSYIFLRTARILKPNDYCLLQYSSELAFKDGSIEKGCSLLIKAAKAWSKKG